MFSLAQELFPRPSFHLGGWRLLRGCGLAGCGPGGQGGTLGLQFLPLADGVPMGGPHMVNCGAEVEKVPTNKVRRSCLLYTYHFFGWEKIMIY